MAAKAQVGGKAGMVCPLCHPELIEDAGDVDIFSDIWKVNSGAIFEGEE
jgi:hypothetical protein